VQTAQEEHQTIVATQFKSCVQSHGWLASPFRKLFICPYARDQRLVEFQLRYAKLNIFSPPGCALNPAWPSHFKKIEEKINYCMNPATVSTHGYQECLTLPKLQQVRGHE
jgi:hypothetical protein